MTPRVPTSASEVPPSATNRGLTPLLARDDGKYEISTSDAADFERLSSIFKLQYTSDGVHRQLSTSSNIVFCLSDSAHTVTYRAPRAGGSMRGSSIPFHLFVHPAVNPPVRRLVIISRQFPWPVEVNVERDRAALFVSVGDVLNALRRAAWVPLTHPEYRRAVEAEDGRMLLNLAHELRTLALEPSSLDNEPYRRMDVLGQTDVLSGLRKEVGNAVLVPGQWPSGKEEALVLVADFVSYRQVDGARRA